MDGGGCIKSSSSVKLSENLEMCFHELDYEHRLLCDFRIHLYVN